MPAGGPTAGQASVSVVLIDDQRLIRTALRESLTQIGGVEIVGEAETGEEGIEAVVQLNPDVVVMDLSLPGISGVEATRRLASLAPYSRVLVLTGSEEYGVVEAIVAGACGFLLKDSEPTEIAAAVKAAAAGESIISSRIAGDLLDRVRERDLPVTATSPDAAEAIRASLTRRELDVLRLLASGKSNPEIGRELHLSPKTVKNHIASILTKLQLENRIQAAVHAVRSGIA